MAYIITTPIAGILCPIASTITSTYTDIPLGSVVKAKDPTYGEGEFIFLTGVASTVVGSVVTWDGGTYQTTLLAANAASLTLPARQVAVAMSANLADAKGWYCIRGNVAVVKNTLYPSSSLAFSSSAAGSVKSGTTSGQAIERMFSIASTTGSANSATTAATDTVIMELMYPSTSNVPSTATG